MPTQDNIHHSFESPITTEKSINWLKIILFVVVAIALFSIGIYLGTTYFSQSVAPVPVSTPRSTPTPEPGVLKDSFQEILAKKCKKIGNGSSYFYGIVPRDLPVTIDPQLLAIDFMEQGTLTCAPGPGSSGTPGINGFVTFRLVDGTRMNLYDEKAEELGHDGPPLLGSFGRRIEAAGDMKLAVYLSWGQGYAFVGDLGVIVRGEKKMQLSTGDVVFVNAELKVINEDDPRLIKLLNENSRVSEAVPGRREVSYEGTEEKVVQRFFNNMAALESPEKENIQTLKMFLDAVQAK